MFSERSADGSPSLRSATNRRSPARSTVAFGPVFSCETVLITAILFPTFGAWSRPIVLAIKRASAGPRDKYLARRKRAPVKPISHERAGRRQPDDEAAAGFGSVRARA